MPLINLQTDLKSIKYGQDRPGGGDSGLPYIQTDINSLDNPNRTQVGRLITKLRFTKFDEMFITGDNIINEMCSHQTLKWILEKGNIEISNNRIKSKGNCFKMDG